MLHNILKHRRGTTEEWLATSVIPEDGELIIEECADGSRRCKLGDGSRQYKDLPYIDENISKSLLGKISELEKNFSKKLSKIEDAQSSNNDFFQQLDERIDALAENMTNSFKTGDEAVLGELNQKLDRFDSTVKDLDQQISKSVSSLRLEIKSASDNNNDTLNESIYELDNKFSKSLKEETNKVVNRIDTVENEVTQLETRVNDSIKTATSQTEDLITNAVNSINKRHSNDVSELSKLVADSEANFNSKIAECSKTSNENLRTTAASLEEDFNSKLVEIDNTIQNLIYETDGQQDSKIRAIKAELEKKIVENTKTLVADIDKLYSSFVAADNTLSTDIEQIQQQNNAFADSVLSRFTAVNEEINQLLEADKANVNTLYSVRDSIIKLIKSVADDLGALTRKHITEFDSLSTELNLQAKAQQEIDLVQSINLIDYITGVYVELAKFVDDQAKIITKIEFVEKILSNKIKKVDDSVNNVQNNLDVAVDELTGQIGSTKEQLLSEDAAIRNDLEAIEANLLKSIDVSNTDMSNKILVAKALLENRIETLRSSMDSKIASNVDNLTSSIDAVRSDLLANIDATALNLSAQIDDMHEQTSDKIEILKSDLAADIAELHSNISKVEIETNQNLDSAITGVKEELNNKINLVEDELKADIDSNNQYLLGLNTRVGNLVFETSQEFDSVRSELTNKTNKLDLDIIALDANINDKISESLASVEDEFNSKLVSIEDNISENAITINRTASNLSKIESNLYSEIQQVDSSIQDANLKIDSLASNIALLDNAIVETTSSIRRDTANQIAEAILQNNEVVYGNVNSSINVAVDKATNDITNLLANEIQKVQEFDSSLSTSIDELKSSNNIKFIQVNKDIDTVVSDLKKTNQSIQVQADNVDRVFEAVQASIDNNALNIADIQQIISDHTDEVNDLVDTQNQRINAMIRLGLYPDANTIDSEVVDIRVGYNGLTHETAGDAVRAIGEDLDALKNSLPDYIPANAIDGLLYEDNLLYLTSDGIPVSDPVEITGGGGGGSISVVKVTNNLASNTFTVSKGNDIWIDFTYTSFENDVATGDGTYKVAINNKNIAELTGSVQHGVSKRLNITDYLKAGANNIKVTCTDSYGISRSLVYNISLIELRVESNFDSTRVFDDNITFRYKVFGTIEKTAYILIDGKEYYSKTLGPNINGNENTIVLPKQSHGMHKITVYLVATIEDAEVFSNILEYEIVCIEQGNNESILTSAYNVSQITQGDLLSIPFMLYDPTKLECIVDFKIHTQVAGELIELEEYSLSAKVDRGLQYWNTRTYPVGQNIFSINYTYDLYGVETTITKAYNIDVKPLDLDIEAEDDSLQLYLSAQGRSNMEQNPSSWTFTPKNAFGKPLYDEVVTTTFENFNWISNGWITDKSTGNTFLRLNGDARATINFKPFKEDFKVNGKTFEFEFAVRDVNSRNTNVIECYNGEKGFIATPDTALFQSSGTKVTCRYKDEEIVRVAIVVEPADSLSRFVSIYLDGVLSGVQRYAESDGFSQQNPVNITFGSNSCGLDIYNIRVYNKALSTQQILKNYIADQSDTSTKLKLLSDNDVLDENGKVSYERVQALGQLPIITFTGQMPTYKGDKRKKSVRMKFEDPLHPELNFDELLDQIDVQGTSSQYYVRKNWKVKLPEARAHMPGAIPAKVFCIKVDYAEATGTHNTGSANFIETLYDRNLATLPPQKDDTRVRTTIQGFPCIIFEKATEDSEPVFSSKGNFNYDKDAENAFGFTEKYEDFGVECWEFCNNTSDSVNFVGSVPTDWSNDFEPRFVPESANFERIEELLELKELAENGKATMTDAQKQELSMLQADCIANFKIMHDWVLSTTTYKLVDGQKVDIEAKPLAKPITYGDTTYTEDNKEYRLAKFKYEFTKYFNMHYSSIYYVFTLFALMTDQRAKNLFLTRWKDDDGIYRWYPYFYDNDTIFGINNEGALVFDYYHEDIDQLGSSNVFNGQNSVLWNNFRLCFPQEIQNTYANLRSDKKLTYDAIINQFVTEGSDKWSAAIYNEDAEYKYVSMARPDDKGNVDASNLYQVRGPGEHHLRYFIANRLNYCDSKWYAGDYPSDDIFLRIYTPKIAAIPEDASEDEIAKIEASNERIRASIVAVPPNPNITLTPFSDMYAGVRYKTGVLQQARLSSGRSYEFAPPLQEDGSKMTFSDTETAIYGASELSSLGDLSGLYCGVINLSNASKLTHLKIGNESADYYNDNFREISVGSNRLLKSIDLRNCSGLGIAGDNPQKTLDLTGCPNIEEVYTEGTNLTTVALPANGYIKTLHLPASTTSLVLKNQQHLEDFSVESYDNIKVLNISNCPTLDTNEILSACCKDDIYTVERVYLTSINWTLENADFVKNLFPKFDSDGNIIGGIRGIDENNNELDDAFLEGSCYIDKLTGAEYAEIKEHYPYLNITYGEMTSDVIFLGENGEELHRETVTNISPSSENWQPASCPDPVESGYIDKPEKESTAEFDFEWNGWTRQLGGQVHADALLNIEGDRILYPAFKGTKRKYLVTFYNYINLYNQMQKHYEVEVEYGQTAEYLAPEPYKIGIIYPSEFEFVGWYPSPTYITGPLDCYAQFRILDDAWHDITLNDVKATSVPESNSIVINELTTRTIQAYRVPSTLGGYTVVQIGGFGDTASSGTKNVACVIELPDCLRHISDYTFQNCMYLYDLVLPNSLTSIGSHAFRGCNSLDSIGIPKNVSTIGDGAFDSKYIREIIVHPENTNFSVVQNCLIDVRTKKLIVGISSSETEIPQNGEVTQLGAYAFSGNYEITSIQIPNVINTVSSNAFSRCSNLKEVINSSNIKTFGATCFAWCESLEELDLSGAQTILSYAFNGTGLKSIKIPQSIVNNRGIYDYDIDNKAFGEITCLEEVTFGKSTDAEGNIIIPKIHPEAFSSSGDDNHTLTFNVPWSEAEHAENWPDCSTWGAINCTFNFDYKEVN